MNRKWCGSFRYTYFVLSIFSLALLSCTSEIPGDPKKTLEEYITAVQKGNFETVYRLNKVTARQKKYLEQTKIDDFKKILKQNYEKNWANYKSVKPSFIANIQWAEKHFFPPSCSPSVGKPQKPTPIGNDRVNVEYEEALTIIVPVFVTYNAKRDAPKLNGRKIKSTGYVCILGKIREGSNVRIYSHDDQWFFGSCILDTTSAKFF